MAKSTPKPPVKGTTPKPQNPNKTKPASPRVVSCQVFNDFAAI